MRLTILRTLSSIFLVFSGFHVYGTTLEKLTFEEMVAISQLIIQAQVSAVGPVESDNISYTRVLLKVDDVLKGEDPGEFIELYFLGGENDGLSVQVSGQDIPEKGERGFYFIESTDTRSVNPLTGWSQGHFRIITDAKGVETLETDIQQELVELSDNKNAALANKLRHMKFSSSLVEKAYFSPVTPEELRQAVYGFLDGTP